MQPAQGPLPASSVIVSSLRASSPSSRSGLPAPHEAVILPGTGHVSRMPTPRAAQARDELGLKARLPQDPPDDVGLDAGSSRREGTGLWGWLWGPWRFPPAPRGYVHSCALRIGEPKWPKTQRPVCRTSCLWWLYLGIFVACAVIGQGPFFRGGGGERLPGNYSAKSVP